MILNLNGKGSRDRDQAAINRLKGVWNFWKKKTGNYLANKFFEESEYFNAYRIYSALREIDPSPAWQVPVLYQIALCEEKLGNYVQAMETYSSIEEYVTSEEARERMASNKYLNFVFGMAKWRREQLEDTRAIRQAVNRYGIYTRPEATGDEIPLPRTILQWSLEASSRLTLICVRGSCSSSRNTGSRRRRLPPTWT